MIIGKTFKFEAAHHLPGHIKCGRTHGHTYKLTVEVEGKTNEYGMVMDLHALSDIVQKAICFYDHTDLNERFIFTTPTCENLVDAIWHDLFDAIDGGGYGVGLYSVQLQEGEGGYARKER